MRPRAGNMGHIILLSKTIEDYLQQRGDEKTSFVTDEEVLSFQAFCRESLSPALARQNQVLVADVRHDTNTYVHIDNNSLQG